MTLVAPVIATVVFEFWPVVFGLLTLTRFWRRIMLEGAPPAKGVLARMLVMLFVGGVGVSLAVLSDTSSLGWSSTAIIGVGLAVLSTFGHALSAITSQMVGVDQRDPDAGEQVVVFGSVDARSSVEPEGPSEWDRTIVSTSNDAASKLLIVPFIAVAAVFVSLPESDGSWVAGGLLCAGAAAVTQVAANWFFQHANHLARDAHGQTAAQINTLYYLTPVGALLLLAWFADTTVERPGLLIVGVTTVVVVNMVLHVDSEPARQLR